ncbi:MAG: OmpA family protein [Eudoraea sp.]|nr:OmpA family protein [Eudoraea sp.]
MRTLLLISFILFCSILYGQSYETIELLNGSFEGIPGAQRVPPGWYDCGKIYFNKETPPDTQPMDGFDWSVAYAASDGMTYMGMVVRDNDTWEFISQRLASPMNPGKCYNFSIDLMRSDVYRSASRSDESRIVNYITPTKLRIWGGNGYCQKKELLAESQLIDHNTWKQYDFRLEPKSIISSFTLEVFFKTPTLIPYNGNILMDNASHIQEIPCETEVLAEVPKPIKPKPQVKPTPEPPIEPEVVLAQPEPDNQPVPRKKIISGLTKNNLVVGQKILVEQLYFKADSSAIGPGSFAALDEIYVFLEENPNLYIEVGGHTNGIPDDAICDKLSTDRARAVATYLIEKGINDERISYKGYGKRQRIASDRTRYGRAKNQRVEIKILSLKA